MCLLQNGGFYHPLGTWEAMGRDGDRNKPRRKAGKSRERGGEQGQRRIARIGPTAIGSPSLVEPDLLALPPRL